MKRLALLALAAAPASAQPAPPDYGFNFITIGDVGNPGYTGPDPDGHVFEHGSVGYEYRIARTEVTTAQYVEFLNGQIDAGLKPNLAFAPLYMGGGFDFGNGRWVVSPGGDRLPIAGVSWRSAAIFMNWLHNGKVNTIEALSSGAYDVSTFNSSSPYTDQSTRSPGAKYWIPSLDEWMKAAHYDPDRYGPGEGGWWNFNNSSDTMPVPGLPGEGDTSAGLQIADDLAFAIPLESYPETTTPWGLLDTSGGGGEWTEDWRRDGVVYRVWQGNAAGRTTWNPLDPFSHSIDEIWRIGAERPNFPFALTTFRVASLVPMPGVGSLLIVLFATTNTRRRSR
ncbi:MAG: SUMF1/EgtB/PvdO family nonheme iron enzyme [Phycisphaerales bacterium]|nr:SUMF1/EgtB/PvdO family nonheme iron enzyme [Phycisphaerales bacterium]MCB9835387.1 SUMF1/EgtB/PvdO family nonheme iron enzyme [Phycisphaera sp.]